MRKLIINIIFLMMSLSSFSQDPLLPSEKLDKIAENANEEIEDDGWMDDLVEFKKHPLSVNSADAEELKHLRVLSDLQIDHLISYRKLFGKLLHIYELQAVPGWSVDLIRKLLPFLTITEPLSLKEDLRNRWKGGEQMLIIRAARILEKAKGYNKDLTGNKYLGSPDRILFRYRFNFKNLLQFGIVGDKDAGEPFNKMGFDFYSFHFFVRKLGRLEQLGLGDYTIRMGQGLINWQGMSFRMGSDMMSIKRQGPALSPYRSAGEYDFFRGAAVGIKFGKWELTTFASCKKTDEQQNSYHRTASEIERKNNITELSTGGILKFRSLKWNAALNGIVYKFSKPLQRNDEPYDMYSINADRWFNISADYSCTYKNMHWFGEVAIDKNSDLAFLQGLVVSTDPRSEISFLYRKISPAYQSVSGKANTQNSSPTNEEGIYAGITVRPFDGWRFDAFAAIYVFPWLKYRINAPAHGYECMLQLSYTPNKVFEFYSRYKASSRLMNIPYQSWRLHINYKISQAFSLRNRCEMIFYDKRSFDRQNGFLIYCDVQYQPPQKKYGVIMRAQYFETDGYDARIYAYENDVLYDFAIPAYSGNGYRYYSVVQYALNKKIALSFRAAQTKYMHQKVIGSGLDEINGKGKNELKLQARWIF